MCSERADQNVDAAAWLQYFIDLNQPILTAVRR